MPKTYKKSKKNLEKRRKTISRKIRNRKIRKTRDTVKGGCPDCGGMVMGGSCGCQSKITKKRGGTSNMDKLHVDSYYQINKYVDDPSRAPFLQSSTLHGNYSKTTGGKRNKLRNKKGGGVLNMFSLNSPDHVTTNNTLSGVFTQRDILSGSKISTSNPMDQPPLNKPYGFNNPPLV